MNTDLFENASIPKAYFTFALPVVVSMVITLVYNLCDTYFVSQSQNVHLVAGVSLCAPLFTLMLAIGDIFGIGGSSLISRLLGEKKIETIKNVSSFSFYSSIFTGILVIILMTLFKGSILNFLGATSETITHAQDYYKYIVFGAPAIIFSIPMANNLRGVGLAKESMIGTVFGSIVNIILDPIFISVLGLGAAGAASATVIGYVATDIVLAYMVVKKTDILSLDISHTNVKSNFIYDIFVIGIPASITNLMQSFNVTILNKYLVPYGTTKVAAMGIALKLNMIIMLVMIGFAFGAQPLLGYNYGARNTKRLKEVIKFDLLVEIGFSVITGIILIVFARNAIGVFMKDTAIIKDGALMLRLLSISTPFVGIVLVFTTLFQVMGKALFAFILSIARQGVVFYMIIVITSKIIGYSGIISAQAISDVVTAITALIFYKLAFRAQS